MRAQTKWTFGASLIILSCFIFGSEHRAAYGEPWIAGHTPAHNVCGASLFGPNKDAVFAIGIFKDGSMQVYVCDNGYSGPSLPHKPVFTTRPTPGNYPPYQAGDSLGSYQKFSTGSDPCIQLETGGDLEYYCWTE